jgi:hypothetical protein
MMNFLENSDSIRPFVIVAGILAGLGGIVHGLTEVLKGNMSTGSFYLENFGAFSVIPNYLITGFATIAVALAITIWAIFFIHKRRGPNIFMALSILLFFVGGGVAQLLGCLITWGAATRINKPLTWWRRVMPENTRKRLARLWLTAFALGFLSLTVGIGIWIILLTPGAAHNNAFTNYLCWTFLLVGLIFLILTLISGFARDIQKQNRQGEAPHREHLR